MMAVGAFVSSSRCAHAAVHVHKVKGVLETHVLVSRALRGYPTRSVAAWSAVDGGTAGSLSILRQSKDSWHLYFEENRAEGPQQPQRVLLVDGTNLACLCAGGRHKKRSPFSDKLEGVLQCTQQLHTPRKLQSTAAGCIMQFTETESCCISLQYCCRFIFAHGVRCIPSSHCWHSQIHVTID